MPDSVSAAVVDTAEAQTTAANAQTAQAAGEAAQVVAAASAAAVATSENAVAQAHQAATVVQQQAAEQVAETEAAWGMLGTQMENLLQRQTESETRTTSLIQAETTPLKESLNKILEALSQLNQPRSPGGIDPAQKGGADDQGNPPATPPKRKHRLI